MSFVTTNKTYVINIYGNCTGKNQCYFFILIPVLLFLSFIPVLLFLSLYQCYYVKPLYQCYYFYPYTSVTIFILYTPVQPLKCNIYVHAFVYLSIHPLLFLSIINVSIHPFIGPSSLSICP